MKLEDYCGLLAGCALLLSASAALADGELNIYNWGNYTSPDLIKKFEETYKVKVTITDYDSNDTALAKIAPAATASTSSCRRPASCRSGSRRACLLESRPDQMENFKNVDRAGSMSIRSGPPLHGSVAVGHDRCGRQHQVL